MNALGVFEGGGAKGLAHVGALKAAEKRNIVFSGVAGASAAAIVAAMISAGYKADDLFNPKSTQRIKVFDKDYLSLLDEDLWRKTKPLLDEIKRILAGKQGFSKAKAVSAIRWLAGWPLLYEAWKILGAEKKLSRVEILLFLRRHKWFFQKIVQDQGIFDTTECQKWVEGLLRERSLSEGQ